MRLVDHASSPRSLGERSRMCDDDVRLPLWEGGMVTALSKDSESSGSSQRRRPSIPLWRLSQWLARSERPSSRLVNHQFSLFFSISFVMHNYEHVHNFFFLLSFLFFVFFQMKAHESSLDAKRPECFVTFIKTNFNCYNGHNITKIQYFNNNSF